MKLVARIVDDPAKLALRVRYMDAHLAYLAVNEAEILVAGSLREGPDDVPIGALWILETDSLERARELIESDPFFQQGLRASYEVLYWSKAFPHPVSV